MSFHRAIRTSEAESHTLNAETYSALLVLPWALSLSPPCLSLSLSLFCLYLCLSVSVFLSLSLSLSLCLVSLSLSLCLSPSFPLI